MSKKELTIKEIRDAEIGVLKFIVNICEQENLKYYLSYGSLLGAVRHKGFIPWDDDIDIQMTREDMDKLIKYFSENDTYPYVIKTIENDDKYICSFPKVMDSRIDLIEDNANSSEWGPYVDVFPLDKAGATKEEAIKLCNSMYLPGYLIYLSAVNSPSKAKSFIKQIGKMALRPIALMYGSKRLIKKFNKKCLKYSNLKDNKYLATLTSGNVRGIMPKEIYDETTLVEFEGEKFVAVKDYDYFLSSLYGKDYMELPPEEKRVCHNLKAFWKN